MMRITATIDLETARLIFTGAEIKENKNSPTFGYSAHYKGHVIFDYELAALLQRLWQANA